MTTKPKIKPIRWTIPGYFYAKSVSIVAGKRGGGKSLFMSWLTAMASQGRYIDKAGHERQRDPMNVWVNVVGEDPVEEFWHPRLKLAGADFDHVRITEERYLFPESLGSLRERLYTQRAEGFPVDILILESMSTHLRNPYFGFERNRQAMSGLVYLAGQLDLAIIFAHHFNKGRRSTVESAIGGQGIIQNAAKAIHVVGSYPDASSPIRVFANERINGQTPAALQFELRTKNVPEAKAPHPYLVYTGPVALEARDVYEASRNETKGSGRTGVDVAAEFIREYLRDGRVAKVSALEEAAQAAEVYFSKGTFDRARNTAGLRGVSDAKAREILGAEYDFIGDADGRTKWVMLPKAASGEEVVPNEPVGRNLRLVDPDQDGDR
jgi:hypothetical protein